MADASPPQPTEDAQGSPPVRRSVSLSLARASLLPFFLISAGHYHSFTLVLADHLFSSEGGYPFIGGRFFWVAKDERAYPLISTVMVVAVVSFVLLCFAMAATVFTSGRLSPGESLSKMRGLWRGPSIARLYFTVLFLGYVLSLVPLVAVTLVTAAGYSLRLGTWVVLLFLLVLSLSLYLGVLCSVRSGTFVLEEGGRRVEELIWDAVASMEEMKLQGFIIFFVSLVITHGFFLMGQQLWGKSFYIAGETVHLSLLPVLENVLWMLGTCGFFGYIGVLLQV